MAVIKIADTKNKTAADKVEGRFRSEISRIVHYLLKICRMVGVALFMKLLSFIWT